MEVTFHGLEQLASNFRRLSTAARAEGEKALKTGGMLIVAEAQKNLRKQPNSNNTGALSNSGKVRKTGELSYEAGFEMNYAEYVEYGRRPGRMPPVKMLAEWAKKKLRVPDKDKMSVGFLIARKIAMHGTKAKNFFSEATETVMSKIEDSLNNIINKAELRI